MQSSAPGESTQHKLDVVVAYYGIYRKGEYAELLMGTWLQTADGAPLRQDYQIKFDDYLDFEHAVDPQDRGSVNAYGFALVDEQARKAHLVAHDADGDCLCPPRVRATPAFTTLFSATFKAPAAGTEAMTVHSNAGYVHGIPVTDGPVPSPDASHVPAGRQFPTVFYEESAADGDPVQGLVVDIDAPVANLDLSVTQRRDRVSLAADVLFAFDQATLSAKGSDSYNLELSKRRAAAVQKELRRHLTSTDITLVAQGHGEADPVAPNTIDGRDNPRGRKLNRRVEITYGS